MQNRDQEQMSCSRDDNLRESETLRQGERDRKEMERRGGRHWHYIKKRGTGHKSDASSNDKKPSIGFQTNEDVQYKEERKLHPRGCVSIAVEHNLHRCVEKLVGQHEERVLLQCDRYRLLITARWEYIGGGGREEDGEEKQEG